MVHTKFSIKAKELSLNNPFIVDPVQKQYTHEHCNYWLLGGSDNNLPLITFAKRWLGVFQIQLVDLLSNGGSTA